MRNIGLSIVIVASVGVSARTDAPKPPEPMVTNDVDQWIGELGSTKFREREEAERKLIGLGEKGMVALKAARETTKDAEVRQRLDRIIGRIDTPYSRRPKIPTIDFSKLPPIVEKKGKLDGNDLWTKDRAYHVTADLIIPPETTLRIEPGTVILLADGVNIRLESERSWLRAESDSSERPIIFTSMAERDRRPGHWGRIDVNSILVLKNAQIRRGSGIVVPKGGVGLLTSVGIYDTNGDAIRFIDATSGGSKPVDVTVREATGAGLVFDRCSGEFSGCTISGVDVGLRFLKQGHGRFSSLIVEHCRRAAIIAEDGSYPRLDGAIIRHCPIGVVSERSYGTYRDTEISSCETCAMLVGKESYPTIDGVVLSDMSADGVVVTERSYPVVGSIRTKNFRGRELVVSPDSRKRSIEEVEEERSFPFRKRR